MKYKFLYDNLNDNDIIEFKETYDQTVFRTVTKVHCNCNPEYWKEHFHTDAYICEYDDSHINHAKRVVAIWRFERKDILKRVAKKHPRTKVWEVNENMLETRPTADVRKVRQAINILDLYIKGVLENDCECDD